MTVFADYRRGLALITLASLLWSTGGVVTRLLESDEWTVICWRSAFSATLLFGWMLRRGVTATFAALRALGVPGLLAAVLLAVDQALFVAALNRTSVAHVSIVLAAGPLFAALFGWLLLRERVQGHTWWAMAMAGAGIVLMVAGDDPGGSLYGDLLALGLPISFSLAVVVLNRHPGIELVPVVAVASLLVAALSAPFASLSLPAPREFVLLVWFGAFEQAGGTLLFTAGARFVPAAHAMLIAMLETVLAPLWAWLAVGEVPGGRALLGGSLVLAAVGLLVWRELRVPPSARRRR